MLPVEVAGEQMFLAGMRAEPGRSVPLSSRPPPTSGGAAAQGIGQPARHARGSTAARVAAAHSFALRSMVAPGSNTELQQHLEESALRVLTLFAGADNSIKMPNGQTVGGFQAIAGVHRPFGAEGRAGKGRGPVAAHAGRFDVGSVAIVPPATRQSRWPRPMTDASRVHPKLRSTRYPTAFCMDRRSIYSLIHSSRCKLRYFRLAPRRAKKSCILAACSSCWASSRCSTSANGGCGSGLEIPTHSARMS